MPYRIQTEDQTGALVPDEGRPAQGQVMSPESCRGWQVSEQVCAVLTRGQED